MNSRTYILALAALAAVSCYGDRDGEIGSDPDYVVSVEGVEVESDLYLGDRFTCEPTVVLPKGCDETDYEYEWIVGKSEVIATEKNLDWEIYLPKSYQLNTDIPGSFVVRNKLNGLEFRSTFKFKVQNGYTPKFLALYETEEGCVEWMSIQTTGTSASTISPKNGFTRWFSGMVARVNGSSERIEGRYVGAVCAKSELAVFTDKSPSCGATVSMVDTDGDQDFTANMGEIVSPVNGRVYVGKAPDVKITSAFYAAGGAKYVVANGKIHMFSGTDTKTPVFDDEAFVMGENIRQVVGSKQFMRYKRALFVLYEDGTVGCLQQYNKPATPVPGTGGESVLTADELCGAFSEATGKGNNNPYLMHLVVRKGNDYFLYVYNAYSSSLANDPLTLKTVIPIPAEVGHKAAVWFGAFSVRYGFYAIGNRIMKFDYLNITQFAPEEKPFRLYDDKYEIVDVFVLIAGTALSDKDDCTVVYLYDREKKTTTIDVYNTVTGEDLHTYEDILPGRGVEFIKK